MILLSFPLENYPEVRFLGKMMVEFLGFFFAIFIYSIVEM
jgi:hypothetical protein